MAGVDAPTRSRAGAPRWWRIAAIGTACVAAAACLMILAADAEWLGFGAWLASYSLLMVAGVAWLTVMLVGAIRYRAWRLSVIAPVVVLLTAVLVWFGVPHRAVFAVSRPAMQAHAQECTETDGSWHRLVRADEVRRLPDGICLFYSPGSFIDRVGWAYVPDSAAPPESDYRDGGYSYRQVGNGWYRFVWHF